MGWLCNYGYQSHCVYDIHLIMKWRNWQKLVLVCMICSGLVTLFVFLIETLN